MLQAMGRLNLPASRRQWVDHITARPLSHRITTTRAWTTGPTLPPTSIHNVETIICYESSSKIVYEC